MNKKSLWLVVCCLWFGYSFSQSKVSIIPQPNSVTVNTGTFTISSATTIAVLNEELQADANYLKAELEKQFQILLPIVKKFNPGNKNQIVLHTPNAKADTSGLPNFEGYQLTIESTGIYIQGYGPGVFYGIQTLIQACGDVKNQALTAPCVKIVDRPVYTWRGMHLDCSRHFFSKAEIKQYLDYLARYKFNVFHWHLCDDQGWRIEIKKYPLLTSVGSIRKETVIGKNTDPNPKYDGKPYDGYYTQDDIKEIIAYAEQRHISIVPEIEMPGHSLAALSAYPQYSCTGGPFTPATIWGVFEDVYCAGNDSTFVFLKNILSEVCEIFPGRYIHIGGDECPKTRWEKCVKCQKRMKKEKLKDTHELQSYFIKQMEVFLNSKGKQMIGWDEILEGGLAPNAAVMSWRGTQGGIDAAKQHHFVVMTPGKPCYFDHYQSKDKTKEPLAIGGFNPLDSVYAYDPMPKQLNADEKKYILGAQGNVWTEYIINFHQVEYMSLPRMCALSEVVWSTKENKNFTDFKLRLTENVKILDKNKVNYCKLFLQGSK